MNLTELPDGDYCIALEHHPNQREGIFIATIQEGELKGKGFALSHIPLQYYSQEDKNEN